MLPNVRKIFIPDPGMVLLDMDLDSADLRTVVWESDCREMKAWLDQGKKPYVEIAKEYYRDPSITKAHPKYREFKSLAHGSNYRGKAKNIAPKIGLTVAETERVQAWYFGKFPEIKAWQKRVEEGTKRTGTVRNAFGYRMHFWSRIDEHTLNQAVAWIGQSTTACIINRALVSLHRNLPQVQLLLQVHDSLLLQFPADQIDSLIPQVIYHSLIPVPYQPDPMIIPVSVKASAKSWGDCG